jgi:hypothetical protein
MIRAYEEKDIEGAVDLIFDMDESARWPEEMEESFDSPQGVSKTLWLNSDGTLSIKMWEWINTIERSIEQFLKVTVD